MKHPNALLLSALTLGIFLVSCTEDDPEIKITNFSFDEASVEVVEETTVDLNDYLTVEGEDASKAEITFTSDNEEVVTVSGNTLTAAGIGNAKVEATETNTGKTATIDVTVIPKTVAVTEVTLDQEEANLEVGETLQLTATVVPADATEKGVTWSVAFPSGSKSKEELPTDIATVSETGLVTAVTAGSVVVTATTKDGEFTASVDVSITNVPVTGISISSEPIEINGTETIQLTATITPANAPPQVVDWKVEFTDAGDAARTNFTLVPEDFATIDQDGAITGANPCNACVRVVATVVDGDNTFTTSNDINIIRVMVTSITLDPASFTVDVDGTQQVTATVLPENASPNDKHLYWSLAYETNFCDVPPVSNYASVDQNGLVTGILPFNACGGINVVATSENGEGDISGTANFTVNPILVTSIEITDIEGLPYPGKAVELDRCDFPSFQLYTSIFPPAASNKTLTWSVTSGSGMTVNSAGLLTLDAYGGNARITVTTNDGSGLSDYIDVSLTPCEP